MNTNPISTENLEPLEPTEAMDLWEQSKEEELADATMKLQRCHINQFIKWLDSEGISDMRELNGRTIHRFKLAIQADIKQNTMAQRVSTVVRFLNFCVSLDAVAPHVPEQIELPKRGGQSRTESLDKEQADAVLSHLRKFAYAGKRHVILTLTWHTGLRTGTLRALDLSDFEEEESRLRIRHRPETDTPLKNGQAAERYVTLSNKITEVIADWIEHNRPSVTEHSGREPLFTTERGRASVNTLRRWFQSATRPCMYGQDCPHGRERSDCDAAQTESAASGCPSSVSGHPIRRGAITHYLRQDVPEKVVSDRMNVSQDVLDEHYDQRTDTEKAEQRRQFFTET